MWYVSELFISSLHRSTNNEVDRLFYKYNSELCIRHTIEKSRKVEHKNRNEYHIDPQWRNHAKKIRQNYYKNWVIMMILLTCQFPED